MAEIRVEFIKTNLIFDLNTISDSDYSLGDYLECLNNNETLECDEKRESFFRNVEGSTSKQLENSIRHIMNAMVGNITGIIDIPSTYRLALDVN